MINFSNEDQDFKLEDEQTTLFDIESSKQSTCLMLPQFIEYHSKTFDTFQQLWSSRVYSPKLIDSKTIQNPSWLLNILQYDQIFFAFCFLFGALTQTSINLLLIFTCIISISAVAYQNWLLRFNERDYFENQMNNKDRYARQIKLAACGFAIGAISTFLVK